MAKQLTFVGKLSHAEIAHVAYQAWDKDGRPPGRDVQYWLEAEAQLKATRHLLASELGPTRTRTVRASTTKTASAVTPTRGATPQGLGPPAVRGPAANFDLPIR